jgi:DNA polymerase-3 subunit delta'
VTAGAAPRAGDLVTAGTRATDVWVRVVGQDDAVAQLRAAALGAVRIARGEIAGAGGFTHAWLFTGPAGSGRSVAARAFAAALQCERTDEPGCGHCVACRTVLAGTHPDVRVVNPEGLSIGVDEAREIVKQSAGLPATGRWRVVIIEDADRLGERAFNALLKAVEEPAPRTVFMLCSPSSHPDDVAVTIQSRCRLIALRTPPPSAVAAVLEADGVDAATAAWAAAAGQGHVGRSRRLAADNAAREHRSSVLAIPASLTSMAACVGAADELLEAAKAEAEAVAETRDADELEAVNAAYGVGTTGKGTAGAMRAASAAVRELEKRQKSRATRTVRDSLDRALVDLAAFYRDVLLRQASSTAAPAHPDFAVDVGTVAGRVSPAGALQRLDAVLACRAALELNVKPEYAVLALTAALRLPA